MSHNHKPKGGWPSQEVRFWNYVTRGQTGACWLWRGPVNSNGYGRLRWNERATYAHRIAYEIASGPIPDGLVIDHLCRQKNCVNPKHLEPVTALVNQLRGIKGVLTTHCLNGHPYDEKNTGPVKGRPNGRYCRTCHREKMRKKRDS